MAHDLYSRYVWLVDTIRRYGRITRGNLSRLYERAPFSDGKPLTRRTFHNYKEAAQELFGLEIKCDPHTYQYYIENDIDAPGSASEWLLNAVATSELLTTSHDLSAKVYLENVPSAREYLASVLEAMREHKQIQFEYLPYWRNTPSNNIFEPYLLKIFRQRWYVAGRHVGENRIKTYALDRISNLEILDLTYKEPETFDSDEYFRDSFGIVVVDDPAQTVKFRTDSRQAKYFRALPLHHSQVEYVHDNFSIFEYKLKITPDLIAELLSYGPKITVLQPQELKAQIVALLKTNLEQYSQL